MIMVSVLYPKVEGDSFDFSYYCDKHITMVREKLGSACKGIAAERGVAGGTPDSDPTYVAMGHMYFESVADFQTAFASHAESLMADFSNFTKCQPVFQISEVIMQ